MSPYINLAHDLEIQKAIVYLKAKNFTMAIETLKDFEKRDVKVASSAATNLSFLYFLVSSRLKYYNAKTVPDFWYFFMYLFQKYVLINIRIFEFFLV